MLWRRSGRRRALRAAASTSARRSRVEPPKWRARSLAVVSPTGGCPGRRESAPASSACLLAMPATRFGGALVGHALQRLELRLAQRVEVGQRVDQRRRRPAGRPACRPGLRCRARAGRRNAGSPACAARRRTGRRCSGSRPRPSRARRALPHTGHCARHAEVRARSACARSRHARRPLRGSRRRRGARSRCRRCARPCGAPRTALCSVALDTVVPPTNTGSSLATGVSLPVRPTWIVDALSTRRLLLRRVLVRHRPARLARLEAELLLQRAVVDLVDHAVDVERQLVALRARSRAWKATSPAAPSTAACIGLRPAGPIASKRVEQRGLRRRTSSQPTAPRPGRRRRSSAAAAPRSPGRAGAPRRRRRCAG